MRPAAILLAVATCTLAAGCSGGQDSLDTSDAVKTTTVTMPRSYKFDPEVISVKQGATVTWKNEDNFTHDVTIDNGSGETEHKVEPGDSVKITFKKSGTYDYLCRLHSKDMRGKVIVT
jgi:plastocyanin